MILEKEQEDAEVGNVGDFRKKTAIKGERRSRSRREELGWL